MRGTHRIIFWKLSESQTYQDVEIRVGEDNKGFIMDLWGNVPYFYNAVIRTPGGETARWNNPRSYIPQEFTFVYERTRLIIEYQLVESLSGAEVIRFRFRTLHREYGIYGLIQRETPLAASLISGFQSQRFSHRKRISSSRALTPPSQSRATWAARSQWRRTRSATTASPHRRDAVLPETVPLCLKSPRRGSMSPRHMATGVEPASRRQSRRAAARSSWSGRSSTAMTYLQFGQYQKLPDTGRKARPVSGVSE